MQTEQERRTLLAVGLCMLIYLVWMQFYAPPIDTTQRVTTATTVSDMEEKEEAPSAAGPVTTPPGVPASQSGAGVEKTEVAPPLTIKIAPHEKDFETDAFQGINHSKEGAFRSVFLLNYKVMDGMIEYIRIVTKKLLTSGPRACCLSRCSPAISKF